MKLAQAIFVYWDVVVVEIAIRTNPVSITNVEVKYLYFNNQTYVLLYPVL